MCCSEIHFLSATIVVRFKLYLSKMASSVFKEHEPTKEDTMVILVNHDGSICVDHNSLQSLLTNKSTPTSLSVVRVSNTVPANTMQELHESMTEATNSDEDGDSGLPKVNLTVEDYYSPEETRNIANNILNFQGEVPTDRPLSLDATDFNLFVIKNDHCYTPLTSPSQKLPVHFESPDAYEKSPDEILPSYRNERVLKVCLEGPSVQAPTNVRRNAGINYRTIKTIPRMRNIQSDVAQHKLLNVCRKPVEPQQESSDQSTNDLRSMLEEDDFDSEHMPTSESASSDDGSDADFNLHDRKLSRSKKATKGFNRSANKKTLKKVKRKTSYQQDIEMESMLQAMEGGINSTKINRRKTPSTSTKQLIAKKLKAKAPAKALFINKTMKTENTTPFAPLEKTKLIDFEESLSDITKTVEEAKLTPKLTPKKDKKPPAHVTEALFSDMTSLFSSPDIIKKVSTPGRLSVDQRRSVDSIPGTPPTKIVKPEKRKQSKDSLSDDFTQILPKDSSFENICANTNTGENEVKHLDFIDKLINADSFTERDSSLSVPPMNALPSLASILQASGATEAETNMDEATLLSNVVGVNLLGANKLTNPLEAVSIQTLTNDIPDSGPLSAISTGSLDLEENTLLESLHNVTEDISEDFLMHITQTLAENSDIKAVIDKQLESPIPILQPMPPVTVMPKPKPIESPFVKLAQAKLASKEAAMARKEPIQIVRSDGRVITLPPIEAPATRSKRKNLPVSSNTVATVPAPVIATISSTAPTKMEIIPAPKKPETKTVAATSAKKSPEFGSKRSRSDSLQKAPTNLLPQSEDEDDSDGESWRSEDDPDRLWCICQQPHNNRFMICCDKCEDWFHGKCVNVTKAMGQQMEEQGVEWTCPNCLKKTKDVNQVAKGSPHSAAVDQIIEEAIEDETFIPLPPVPYGKNNTGNLSHTTCIVCKKEARASSIYCSDACILKHAQVSLSIINKPPKDGNANRSHQSPVKSKLQNIIKTKSDRVIVFERTTGRCLAGDSAPTVENLEHWLRENPTFEVVLKPGTSHPSFRKKISSPIKNIGQLKKGIPQKMNPVTLNSKLQKVHNIAKPGTPKQIVLIQPQMKQSNANATKAIPTKASTTPVKTNTVSKPGQISSQPSAKTTAPTTPVRTSTPKVEKSKAPAAEPTIRLNVRKTLKEQLIARSSESKDNKWSAEDIKKYCDDIELEMFNLFKDTDSKYKSKYRSLLFNIKDKKNFTLYKKICEGVITPKQLVRMSPDELASQELAQWRAKEAKHQLEMIKKSELDLLACAKTYVLKTHKGEEIIESRASDMTEVDPTVAVEDVVSVLNNSAVSSTSEPPDTETSTTPTLLERHRVKSNKEKLTDELDQITSGEKPKNSLYNKDKPHSREKSGRSSRTRSKNHDKTRAKSDKHNKRSDRGKKQSNEHTRSHQKRNIKDNAPDTRRESGRKKAEKDAREKRSRSKERNEESKEKEINDSKSIELSEIDSKDELNLPIETNQEVPSELPKPYEETSNDEYVLQEGESYQEPTSTVTIPTPEFNESEGSSFSILEERDTDSEVWSGIINMIDVAHFGVVAYQVSGDCIDLCKDLPPSLDIVGRISPSTVWEYIAKMKSSNTKDIIIIQLAALNEEEKVPYVGLYSYLSTRKRLGVIKQTNPAIKDFYIFPLSNVDSIPPVLLPLSGYESCKELRPHVLLGILVRARRKRPAATTLISFPVKFPRTLSSTSPPRSFTPPVNINKRSADEIGYTPPTSPRQSASKKLAKMSMLTESVKEKIAASLAAADDDEPYSPGGSDSCDIDITTSKLPEPPSISDEQSDLEKKMEELNRKIAEQKKQIQTMSAGIIATEQLEEPYSPSRPVSPENPKIPALENISLPSNLQEILASIQGKTANQTTNVSNNLYLPSTPTKSNIATPEDKYTPTAPSLFPNEKQSGDPQINIKQGFDLGITSLKAQIVGQLKSDVSLYSNKEPVTSNSNNKTLMDLSLKFPHSDIDERIGFTNHDIDERISFQIGKKDLDERYVTKKTMSEEIPLLGLKTQTPPILVPPPPVIGELQTISNRKPTSKLAQLSEEELLSMVPDEILSHSKSQPVDESPVKSVNSDVLTKAKAGVIVQSPVMYTKPPPILLKDVPLPPLTSDTVTTTPPPKRPNLEQPPPPGMEDFEEL